MRTHDHEVDPEEIHTPASVETNEGAAVASLALRAGRSGTLDTGAVMHLQRAAGNANVTTLLAEEPASEQDSSPVKDVVSGGGGVPLDPSTRGLMESRLGHDFGDVKVHTGDKATESARSVNAHAYTVGHNVVFQRDAYAPETGAGRRMLAHELTHVIQQRSGPVDGAPAPGGIRVSDPSDRFEREAERRADQAMSSPAPDTAASGPVASPSSLAGVQRQEEEEDLQGCFVQRQAKEEEEELQGCFAQRQQEEEEEPEEAGP